MSELTLKGRRRTKPPPGQTPAETLHYYGWSVDDSGCWNFQGPRASNGYGRYVLRGVQYGAHRVSYEYHVGDIPDSLFILHSCDNRQCVNPDHLRPGDALENAQDMTSRGRWVGNSRLTVEEVAEVRAAAQEEVVPYALVGDMYGITRHQVSRIMRGLSWRETENE